MEGLMVLDYLMDFQVSGQCQYLQPDDMLLQPYAWISPLTLRRVQAMV